MLERTANIVRELAFSSFLVITFAHIFISFIYREVFGSKTGTNVCSIIAENTESNRPLNITMWLQNKLDRKRAAKFKSPILYIQEIRLEKKMSHLGSLPKCIQNNLKF